MHKATTEGIAIRFNLKTATASELVTPKSELTMARQLEIVLEGLKFGVLDHKMSERLAQHPKVEWDCCWQVKANKA